MCQRHCSRYENNITGRIHALTFPGVLHTICFHRYFSPIRPSYLEILDFTLPLIPDPDVETLIDTRVGQLIRQLTSTSSPKSSIRGSLVIKFFEKRKKKSGGLGWFGKGDEEVSWESWCLEVTLATPKTEIGRLPALEGCYRLLILLQSELKLLRPLARRCRRRQ